MVTKTAATYCYALTAHEIVVHASVPRRASSDSYCASAIFSAAIAVLSTATRAACPLLIVGRATDSMNVVISFLIIVLFGLTVCASYAHVWRVSPPSSEMMRQSSRKS
jgi:hypothetical protein